METEMESMTEILTLLLLTSIAAKFDGTVAVGNWLVVAYLSLSED